MNASPATTVDIVDNSELPPKSERMQEHRDQLQFAGTRESQMSEGSPQIIVSTSYETVVLLPLNSMNNDSKLLDPGSVYSDSNFSGLKKNLHVS